MRIIHLCLSCFYIDNYNYQENILPRIDQENGNDVLVIASTQTFINNEKSGYSLPGEYVTKDGIHVIRISYVNYGLDFITHKIRKYRGLYRKIVNFQPDIIFSHGLGFDTKDVVRYKKNNPQVKIYADTHTAYYNSGTNWISLNVLHKIIYKSYIQKILPNIEKYFYIGINEKEFSIQNYEVPEDKMEYFPLGGIIPDKEQYDKFRKEKRSELEISDGEYLFVHSGKLSKQKKTELLLKAFVNSKIKSVAKLLIIGSIPEEQKKILNSLLNDERVIYVGWKTSEELVRYLCAADLYCQPGSVSATLQQAICCNCPVLSYPHDEYKNINNTYNNFLFCESQEELKTMFDKIEAGNIDIEKLKKQTKLCAEELLDYRVSVRKYTI